MDLNAVRMSSNRPARWARLTALFCFALACGLLISSLSKAHTATAERSGPLLDHALPSYS